MNLRRQGFFREMPHGDEHDPSLEQAVNTLSQAEDVERICSYLDMGKVLIVCCGTCNDVLNPEKGIARSLQMGLDVCCRQNPKLQGLPERHHS